MWLWPWNGHPTIRAPIFCSRCASGKHGPKRRSKLWNGPSDTGQKPGKPFRPGKYTFEVRAIDRAITEREGPVRFRWVRGHVGNQFNEMADELAGIAARAIRDGSLTPCEPVGAQEPVTLF